MSELLRQLVRDQLGPNPKRVRRVSELGFVAPGRTSQRAGDRGYPVSEHYDEALAEDFAP